MCRGSGDQPGPVGGPTARRATQLREDAGHVPHNRFAAMKPDEPNVYVLPFARKIPTPDVHESVANTTSSGNSA